jgi:hypothetical protein
MNCQSGKAFKGEQRRLQRGQARKNYLLGFDINKPLWFISPMRALEIFIYTCPNCQTPTSAARVAASLPDEILRSETARRNGSRQTPHAGPGRPVFARCPGCDLEMSNSELREHRVGCVRDRLRKLCGFKIHLHPKDVDPYPDFVIAKVDESEVEFQKLSSSQCLGIELQKVAEITANLQDRVARIRILGRITWDESNQAWRFTPALLGRPMASKWPSA